MVVRDKKRPARRAAATEPLERRLHLSTARVAVIGDYGDAGPGEASVASLVHGWDTAAAPLDAVITVGDNNYDTGEWSTIDQNVGQYFARYIGDYAGEHGPGAAVNRFFPSA